VKQNKKSNRENGGITNVWFIHMIDICVYFALAWVITGIPLQDKRTLTESGSQLLPPFLMVCNKDLWL
jgi:hypothetical protein